MGKINILRLLFPVWYNFISIEENTLQNEPSNNAYKMLINEYKNKS